MHNDSLCSASAVIMISSLSLIPTSLLFVQRCGQQLWRGRKGKGPVMAMMPILTYAHKNSDGNRAKYSIHCVIRC